jgi:hypothetical protein
MMSNQEDDQATVMGPAEMAAEMAQAVSDHAARMAGIMDRYGMGPQPMMTPDEVAGD